MLDEEALLKLFSPSRVASIKKHCLTTGEWRFDRYEKSKVKYAVFLDDEFENSRQRSVFNHYSIFCGVVILLTC
jgi:hypothetical protein